MARSPKMAIIERSETVQPGNDHVRLIIARKREF